MLLYYYYNSVLLISSSILMNKSVTLNYILASLMIATGIIYFVVAIYGESFEGEEQNHQADAIENDSILNDNTQDNKEELENTESHSAVLENEAEEESENERITSSQGEDKETTETTANHENVEEMQEGKEVEGKEGIETEFNQKEAEEEREPENESVKRTAEFPLFLSAAIGNVLVGSWIFLDNRSKRRLPYMIAIFGTLALLGLYIISRTTSIQPVGIERIGLIDSVTAALQVGIIICSGYVLKTWQNLIVKVY